MNNIIYSIILFFILLILLHYKPKETFATCPKIPNTSGEFLKCKDLTGFKINSVKDLSEGELNDLKRASDFVVQKLTYSCPHPDSTAMQKLDDITGTQYTFNPSSVGQLSLASQIIKNIQGNQYVSNNDALPILHGLLKERKITSKTSLEKYAALERKITEIESKLRDLEK